ncbi:MAG TPA: ABC transporter ATP-binding protein [Thermoanaerobaculia bacterium]|nr:ABC transporter ATP-binding protein [Thermoanaerobaculia bacterium]
MASIALEDVSKVFAGGHAAVRDVTLEIADGELLVLVGPSGSGKSTLLRLVAGLETPTHGRILIGGRDVTAVSPQQRDLAMVFQSYALYPHKTVRENLAFGLRARGVSRPEIDTRVRRVAQTLQIEGLLDRRPAQLSGGQRQRAALGRAMVREPQAFLLDEPLSNLDPALRLDTRTELALLHRRLGATMIYVTHDQEEAMKLGERVVLLRDGAIEQVGPPLEIYRRPATLFAARFLGSPPMNVMAGAVAAARDGVEITGLGLTLPLAEAGRFASGEQVVVGIRPHDVELATTDGAQGADVAAIVEVVEAAGSELHVHLRAEARRDQRFIAVVPADLEVAVESRIGLAFRRDRLHLFAAAPAR